EDYEANVEVWSLRGNLRGLHELRPDFEAAAGRIDLAILDAGYRFTVEGESENDNAAVTARYNLVDRYAAILDAAVAYVHHSSKGSQTDKAIVDVGAGAGAQARAADTHLVMLSDPAIEGGL